MLRRYIFFEDQAFEPTMIGWTPRCYRPSFMEIKYLDPEKKIFEGCLYMGVASGHLTQIS